MKRIALTSISLLFSLSLFAQRVTINLDRSYFNNKKDLLLAQFDNKPDPDDIHAQAAIGSMMLHSDMRGVKVYGVLGAIGEQSGLFLNSVELFDAIFKRRWTDANKDWDKAVEDIVKVVKPILRKGGKVWVQEAGQSNITADWLRVILDDFSAEQVKNNVIVVQHSNWNDRMTNKNDLAYVKRVATYFGIDDGNAKPNYHTKDRGPYTTPEYRSKDSKWMAMAKESSDKRVAKIWRIADNIMDSYFPNEFDHEASYIHYDGVDYSDCCENWWILNIGEAADSHEKFWSRYVTK